MATSVRLRRKLARKTCHILTRFTGTTGADSSNNPFLDGSWDFTSGYKITRRHSDSRFPPNLLPVARQTMRRHVLVEYRNSFLDSFKLLGMYVIKKK